MKIDYPRYSERFGALTINAVQHVHELDSGNNEYHRARTVAQISDNELYDVYNRLAIVVPIRSERLKLLEGVIRGVPHDCLVIIVSNSQRYPIDRYRLEKDTLRHHALLTDRDMLIIHQKDNALAYALDALGYPYIVHGNTVRDGKGEGMLIGILLAKALGKEYIGFIDSDNYIPGAVNEYVKIYASSMLISDSPYTMTRIAWKYKPKVSQEGLYFAKWGRVSEYTNRYINMLISSITGFETDIVKTANSGEHAMSIRLAEMMSYSSGYAIEPYELVYLIEEFGGMLDNDSKEVMSEGINIMQVETINPHIHEDKGTTHIREMLKESLSTVYYSRLSTKSIKKSIVTELKKLRAIKSSDEIYPIKLMPSIKNVDCYELLRILKANSSSLQYFGSGISAQMETITV